MLEPHAEAVMPAETTRVQVEARSDEEILEELFARYSKALYRYALAILNSADDAEDAVQEVWVRLARRRSPLGRVGNPKAYLFSATRNTAYNVLRGRGRRREVDETYVDLDSRPSLQRVEASIEAIVLRECFSQLPVEQREVLALKIGDEMTFEEIARTVGASVNTVAGRYRYGIEKLRHALEGYDG